jgi:hypothetical protein
MRPRSAPAFRCGTRKEDVRVFGLTASVLFGETRLAVFSLLEETAPADLEAFVPGGRADSNVGLRAADAVEFWFRVPVLRICERPKFGQYQNFGPYVGNRTAT